MTEIRANMVHLGKWCEFYYNGEHTFAGLGKCLVRDVPAKLAECGGDEIQITFRWSSQHGPHDQQVYTRRLEFCTGYEFSDWFHPPLGDGVNTVKKCCVATRKQGAHHKQNVTTALVGSISKMEASSGTGHDVAALIRDREKLEKRWIFEDDLPELQDWQVSTAHKASRVIFGVRMYPRKMIEGMVR